MSIFCGRKWRRGDPRPRCRPTIRRAWLHFFFFTCSELRDWSTSEHQWVSYPCKVVPLSDEVGLWDRVKKVKTNKFSLNNGEKFMEFKTGLQSSTDRSWAVLVRRSFRTRHLSGAVVYFATQYNVHYNNRQTGHLLSALRLERCTDAIIFPHNKMA